jgi:VanZ family protein
MGLDMTSFTLKELISEMTYRVVFVFLVVAVVVLSLLDTATIDHLYHPILDGVGLRQVKMETVTDYGHLVAGFILTLLALRAFPRRTGAVLSALVFFFAAIELFQGFTATRTMSIADLLRSVAGIGGGVLFHIALGFGRAGENGKG